MSRGSQYAIPLLLVTMTAVAGFSYWRLRASNDALEAAARTTRECEELMAQITELRRQPRFAAWEVESVATTAEHIEYATAAAQLPPASLVRIQPRTAAPLGDSPYRIRPTQLEVRDVTLAEVVTFAHYLVDEARGLTVRDLRIWHTGNDSISADEETWNVELTLTQLIFSPKSGQSLSRS